MNPSSNPKTDPLSQLPPQAGRRRIDTTCPPTPPEGGRPPDRHPQVADDPRIDTLRWRTTPDRPPWQSAQANHPPHSLPRRTNPGSTPSGGGRPRNGQHVSPTQRTTPPTPCHGRRHTD